MEAKPSPTGSPRRSPRDVKPLLWLATAVIAALVLLVAHGTNSSRPLAAIRPPTPVATSAVWEGAPQAGAAQRPAYQVLDADLETLRRRFNQDADEPRVLMLLSPT